MSDQDALPQTLETGSEQTQVDPLLGRVIVEKFKLEKLLGVGAMGRVYRAEHLSLSQKVAVKVLHQHLTGDDALARRFHREAKSAFTLKHPNSITIMDFGQEPDGLLYIAMELLEGRSLHDVIEQEGPLPLERSVRILSQVCLALDEAHHQGIVHRDLKPENVMVQDRRSEPDYVKVCDFGIAKVQDESGESAITMAGMVCGTPEYMSPEQARGESLDGRSDLYALGVILYYMTTQRLPFTAETALGCVTKHLTDEPPRPSEARPDLEIPPVLEAFILRCLSKDREERPATAAAFLRELQDVADKIRHGELGESAEAVVDFAPETTAVVRRGERRRFPALLLLVAVVVVAGGVGLWLALRGSSAPPRPGTSVATGPPPSRLDARPAPASPKDGSASRRGEPGAAPDAATAPPSMEVEPSRPPRPRVRPRRRRGLAVRPRPRERPRQRPVRPRPVGGFDEAYQAARAAWSSGAYGRALKEFRRALGFRPGHAATVKYIAQCYVRLSRPCTALRWFKRYQRQRPGDFFVKQYVKTLSAKCTK